MKWFKNNWRGWMVYGLILFMMSLFVNQKDFFASLFVDQSLQIKKAASLLSNFDEAIRLNKDNVIDCQVIVAGAGAGGIAASIEAARSGVKVCLFNDTDWIGGMLSAAGVSAIDGRPDSSSGIFKEFIDKVIQYYKNIGREEDLYQCKVSYLCYEPNVGSYILEKMISRENNIKYYPYSEISRVYQEHNQILGIEFIQKGITYIARGQVTIDATEFGDLMYMANIPYRLGADIDSMEPSNNKIEKCVQPITYVAILQRNARKDVLTVPKNYNENNYSCSISNELCKTTVSKFSLDYLMSYGKMPAGKLMINVPSHSFGNDFNADALSLNNKSRVEILQMAKDYTLGYLYYLYKVHGFNSYSLFDEFGTDDKLAVIPYVRESRRLKGLYTLTENDLLGDSEHRSSKFTDSIAIGDYPIDIHYCSTGIGDVYEKVVPYEIPLRVIIPEKYDGFLVAEKNISVTHIANGTTRLQPVVMSVGQASGALAALAVTQNKQPRNVLADDVQNLLLAHHSMIYFFGDVDAQQYYFKPLMNLAADGVIKGFGDMKFHPEDKISSSDFITMLEKDFLIKTNQYYDFSSLMSGKFVSRKEALNAIYEVLNKYNVEKTGMHFSADLNSLDKNKIAVLISSNVLDNSQVDYRFNDYLTRAEAVTLLWRLNSTLLVVVPNG